MRVRAGPPVPASMTVAATGGRTSDVSRRIRIRLRADVRVPRAGGAFSSGPLCRRRGQHHRGEMVRSAAAFRRNGRWIFHSDCKTTAGVWVASPPFLSSGEIPAELGACVGQTLNGSTEGVPHPTEWGKLFSPALQLAGVKTWPAFVTGALLVEIEMGVDTITLTPHRNVGPKEGFVPLESQVIILAASATPGEIGEALLKEAATCTFD